MGKRRRVRSVFFGFVALLISAAPASALVAFTSSPASAAVPTVTLSPEPDLTVGGATTTVSWSGFATGVVIAQCPTSFVKIASLTQICRVMNFAGSSGSESLVVTQFIENDLVNCMYRNSCWVLVVGTDNEIASHELDSDGPISVPVVDAGADFTVASGASFGLSGTATSPNGAPISYAWTQISGPSAVIAKPDELMTNVTGVHGPATLKFKLTVTDPRDGTSSNDAVTVTVKAPK